MPRVAFDQSYRTSIRLAAKTRLLKKRTSHRLGHGGHRQPADHLRLLVVGFQFVGTLLGTALRAWGVFWRRRFFLFVLCTGKAAEKRPKSKTGFTFRPLFQLTFFLYAPSVISSHYLQGEILLSVEVLHFFLLLVEVDFEFLVSVEVPHKLRRRGRATISEASWLFIGITNALASRFDGKSKLG